MWKKIKGNNYFLVFTDNLEVFVTDFITIWICNFSRASFLASLKESNLHLDIDENELIQFGKQILMNPDDVKKAEVSTKEAKLVVALSVNYGFPVYLNISLTEGSKELFFQKVTQCLLKTIHNLRASQHELRHLLQKKDKEIEEYKCEGGEIALRHLKTVPFNDELHMCMHNVYEDNFGSSDIPNDLLVKAVEIPNGDIIKQEHREEPAPVIKKEEEVIVKTENIKTELKTELKTESSHSSLVSPRKKQKVKLNI